MEVKVVTDILKANDAIAAANRKRFDEAGVFVANLMSSPGAGKTTLLEKTIPALRDRWHLGAIEGDVATARDAERIAALNVPVVQITTRGACHLDANMVARAMGELPLSDLDVVFIENVGNLICPAGYRLGEHARVVLLSVTEGEDKPVKYPLAFRNADLLLITKTDLLGSVTVRPEVVEADARRIQPNLEVMRVSSVSGEGLDAWAEWVSQRAARTSGSSDSRSPKSGKARR